jgi:hypothetical protein
VVFRHACKMGLEGIVSRYQADRQTGSSSRTRQRRRCAARRKRTGTDRGEGGVNMTTTDTTIGINGMAHVMLTVSQCGRASTRRKVQFGSGLFDVSLRLISWTQFGPEGGRSAAQTSLHVLARRRASIGYA